MLVRLAALAFGLIESLLLLRLALPFVKAPKAVQQYVPLLLSVTNVLLAPFEPFVRSFQLDHVGGIGLPGGGLAAYAERVDPGVIVAIVGWAAIAVFISVVLTLVVRIRA